MQHQERFAAAQCNVVTVSFSPVDGARQWVDDTRSPFRMLMDPSRTLYSAFGLPKSIAKVLFFVKIYDFVRCELERSCRETLPLSLHVFQCTICVFVVFACAWICCTYSMLLVCGRVYVAERVWCFFC